MKKLAMLFSMLAAILLMSALPAFSGSGPYGTFGPDFKSADTHLISVAGGTGPYGAFGLTYKGVDMSRTAVAGGSGPYGIFGPSGMQQWGESHQVASKDECLLVAKNCPPDMAFVQNRIDRLNAEIAKGTDVYTPAELRVLNDKLNAAYEELNRTNSGY